MRKRKEKRIEEETKEREIRAASECVRGSVQSGKGYLDYAKEQ